MADYDIVITFGPLCRVGGIHAMATVDVNNGQKIFTVPVTTNDLIDPLNDDFTAEDITRLLLRNFIKENGLTTMAQIKNAVEAHVFKL